MGKNHRHKKRLKAEKSKTQLKNAAKELLKRQNVTKTEFKIKPIVIKTQLESKTTEDGRKDLSVEDVVNRLSHRNENMKMRACQDMEYLIMNNKISNIPYYFKFVCVFIQEDMPKARRSGLKLLQTMLSAMNEKNCCDFLFQFLLNHLRCAMTSINRRIREDSVLFFDLLLKYLPNFMAKHFRYFLPDFMMLISALKNDAEMRRTVTVNLESKFTSSQWRIAVLSRLHQLLDILLQRKKRKDEGIKKLEELHDRHPFFVVRENNWREELVGSDDERLQDEDSKDVDLQFANLFSILYETWLEGRPVSSSTDITFLPEETAMLFNCIVQTYHIMSSYLRLTQRMVKLKTLEHEKLLRNLVQHLPYGLIKAPKKVDKMSNLLSKFVITDIKCTNNNILICYDYLLLFAANPSKAKLEDINSVADTINGFLVRDYTNNKKMDFTSLFLILKHLFNEKARLWCRNKFPVSNILDGALTLYNNGNIEDGVKVELTKILTLISYEELLENENFASWLENLPKLLLDETIEADLLVAIINRIRFNPPEKNSSFYKGILDNYVDIYHHLPNMKVYGMTELDLRMRKMQIAKFIAYLPEPCPELRSILLNKLDTRSPYWEEIQHLRTVRNDNPGKKKNVRSHSIKNGKT
ncbi:uncharacterized protein LOC123320643 [Coccinella septempunctata]|uniref:uncharacterized protein LOC123320643 n=1 Tax=Coccinella septempunctata TaxID=41139 RepID=UPI001D06788B|nr:uncharacterized protein LOC123320643 [Coccinella septempunctata]